MSVVVWVRSSWCRALRAPVRWSLVGVAGWGQVQLVSRIAGSCSVVAGGGGGLGSGPVGVAHCGLLFGGRWWGWRAGVRSSWCRALRAPVRWSLVGVAGWGQVQLVSRIAGSCSVVAGGGGGLGSGPVGVAHCGLLFGGRWWRVAGWGQVQLVSRIAGSCSVVAGGGGGLGSGPVGVAHCGLLFGGRWWGWRAGVRSSWCRALRAPVRWSLVGVAGWGQVQLVSRIAGSCSVVAGGGGGLGSGPVGVAHCGLLFGGRWWGWRAGVRSSWCRALRAPVRWSLVGVAGWGQVQLVSRIAGSCSVVAGGGGGLGSGPVGVAHCGLLMASGRLGRGGREGVGGGEISPVAIKHA